MSAEKDCSGAQEEILHVSTEKPRTCVSRLCPLGKCRKDGFILVDVKDDDDEEIEDDGELTEKVYKDVSPRRMTFKEEEIFSDLAIERTRCMLQEDASAYADNMGVYEYHNTENDGQTIESTINVQKFRDGRIKKTTQQSITKIYPPKCGIHDVKKPPPKSTRCDPNTP